MRGAVAAWSFAFILTAAMAAGLVGAARPESIRPRDPAKLPAAEADLILHRIREGDLVAIQGDLGRARDLWKSARDQGLGYWPLHEAVGDSLARHGLDAEAEREYETAERLASTQLRAAPVPLKLKRAGLLMKLDRLEPALRLLIECGAPDRLEASILGILHREHALVRVVREAAETRDPRLWAIVTAASTDLEERAVAQGRFVRSVSPGDGELAKRAIRDLRAVRKFDDALKVCTAWSKAAPSNPDAFEAWGLLLADMGDRDRARLILSTIVDVRPGDSSAHLKLASALRTMGDIPEAIRQFEEAYRLRPEEPGPLQEILATLLDQGDIEGAMKRTSELAGRKWEPRFGDVLGGTHSRLADMCRARIDVAKRTNDAAAVTRLRRWATELGMAEAGLFDVKIVMSWDAQSDVDLDVAEPGGETVNHERAKSAAGGIYPFDNTKGFGPEHYLLAKAPKGRYRVGVHLHGSTRSAVEVEVILFEETPRERRLTARAVLEGQADPAWVVEFEIP